MDPAKLFPKLRLLRLSLHISANNGLPPQFYLGSTWRGILGWELKRLVCPFSKSTKCLDCLIQDNCPYHVLFEKKTELPGILDAPRGYVLYSPLAPDSQDLQLEITLLGTCAGFAPAVLQALVLAQKRGLGKEHLQFRIQETVEFTPSGTNCLSKKQDPLTRLQGPFSLSDWLRELPQQQASSYRLRLPTPLRLRRQGKYLGELDLSFMFLCLARRLEALSCIFSQGQPLGRKQWLELDHFFKSLQENGAGNGKNSAFVHKDLKWDDFARFSRRQKKKVPLGGLVGECWFESDMPNLQRWLKCAELVHVGKGAAMGLGKVKITGDEPQRPENW